MSNLADIRERLQDTEGAIARLERDLAAHPELPSVMLEIRSLQKRQRRLQDEFAIGTANIGLEVCNYRILPEREQPKIAGIGSALLNYQQLVSVFYDAIRTNTPKRKVKVKSRTIRESALDFGYAYTGSVGFVFTVSNERTLFDDTTLDRSVRMIFDVAKAERPQQILEFARIVGPAPISVLHRWADDHARNGFSVEIEWRRGAELRNRMLIQELEFQRLRAVIDEMSQETIIETTVSGILQGANVVKRTFEMRPDIGDEIKGHSGEIISESHTVELPKRYTATIRKTTRIHYSTEVEDVSYELLDLKPI